MRRFSIQRADERLILRRRRASYVPSLVGMILLAAALAAACLAHAPSGASLLRWQDIQFVSVSAAICLVFAARSLLGLRLFEIVFDKRIGVVLINGHAFLSLCELQSVHLDFGPQGALIFSLHARSGASFEISREDIFGSGRPELEEMAQEVAEFAQTDLVTLERFVAGIDELPDAGAPWLRPGTVGRMKRAMRQVAGKPKPRHKPLSTLRREKAADGRIYWAEFRALSEAKPPTRHSNQERRL